MDVPCYDGRAMSRVVEFYNGMLRISSKNAAQAFRLGFWTLGTWSMSRAHQNENADLAAHAEITGDMLVFDAGCGIGGSAVWLSETLGATVVGMALSEKEIALARSYAARRRADLTTEFIAGDFRRTPFADGVFDVVWAIESLSYVADKEVALREFYRILKPGGCLIYADFLSVRAASGRTEDLVLDWFCEGIAIAPLSTKEEIQRMLEQEGFHSVQYRDKRNRVLPTSFLHFINSLPLMPFLEVLHLVRIVPKFLRNNARSGAVLLPGFLRGIITYGVIHARKQ